MFNLTGVSVVCDIFILSRLNNNLRDLLCAIKRHFLFASITRATLLEFHEKWMQYKYLEYEITCAKLHYSSYLNAFFSINVITNPSVDFENEWN